MRLLRDLPVCVVILLSSVAISSAQTSRPVDSPFVFTFIDAKTENAIGPFPYDRAILAHGVDKAVSLGAKGVVLKFFLDKPKTPGGDRALIRAAAATKLLIEARLDNREANPNALPERFQIAGMDATTGNLLSGTSGCIPLPELSAAAYDVGFVDIRVTDRMPLVERYKNAMVKSLYLSCIELALGKHAEIDAGKTVRINGKMLPIDDRGEAAITYPVKDDLSYISYSDFLDARQMPQVRDRIVIIGYDAERFTPVDTPIGKVRPHRVFAYALLSLYTQLK